MIGNCGSCSLELNNSDYVTCSGICERNFHGKLACSGIRNDTAKLINKHQQVRYVCEECDQLKISHVLRAITICNDNVLNMQTKIDDIASLTLNSRDVCPLLRIVLMIRMLILITLK